MTKLLQIGQNQKQLSSIFKPFKPFWSLLQTQVLGLRIRPELNRLIWSKVFQWTVLEFVHICNDWQTYSTGIMQQPNLPMRQDAWALRPIPITKNFNLLFIKAGDKFYQIASILVVIQSLTKAIIFELFYYINGYFRVWLTSMNIHSKCHTYLL